MKLKSLIIFIFILTILGCPDNSESKSSVKWESFNTGLLKAKEQKKPVIIDFYADWCHWCKVMDKETFTDDKVTKIMRDKFIAIRIDTEKSEKITYKGMSTTTDRFAPMLGVSGLPTVVFMDKDGNLIDKVPGFVKADIFTGILSYISEGCYKLQISFADYMNKNSDCK